MTSKMDSTISFLVSLLLLSSAQGSPHDIARRQDQIIDPTVGGAPTLVLTPECPAATFSASRVDDSALWTITAPTTIGPGETIFPCGFKWVADATPGCPLPEIPVDAPYPVPEGGSVTDCTVPENTQVPPSDPAVPENTAESTKEPDQPGDPDTDNPETPPPTDPESPTNPDPNIPDPSNPDEPTPDDPENTATPDSNGPIPNDPGNPVPNNPDPNNTGSDDDDDDDQDLGLLILPLFTNRDWIQDPEKKEDYKKQSKDTLDEVLGLFGNVDVKSPTPPECSSGGKKKRGILARIAKRSLISGILDLLDTPAKLLGCTVEVVKSLVNEVEKSTPSIEIITDLTDGVKEITDKLDDTKDDTEDPEECTSASAVPSCTEIVSLTTSTLAPDSTTVETVTETHCETITACNVQPTTVTTTTATEAEQATLVCDADCSICTGGAGLPQKRAPSEPSTPHLHARSLDDIEDMWGGSAGEYLVDRIYDTPGAVQLDWVFFDKDLVSHHFEFGDDPPDRRGYVSGLLGCTAIMFVSEKGYWLSHFMEPGFMDRNQFDTDRWNARILNVLRDGQDKFTRPSEIAGENGIFGPDSNVQVFIATPKDMAGTPLYDGKVDEIMAILIGSGTPFENVPVTKEYYTKPIIQPGDEDMIQGTKSEKGVMYVEYDRDQFNEEGKSQTPRQSIYRVFVEGRHWDHTWAAGCTRVQKRDGTCPTPPMCETGEGGDPVIPLDTAKKMAAKFCDGSGLDFSKIQIKTISGTDIEPEEELNAHIFFSFLPSEDVGQCQDMCTGVYDEIIDGCKVGDEGIRNHANMTTECGSYSMKIFAKPDLGNAGEPLKEQPEEEEPQEEQPEENEPEKQMKAEFTSSCTDRSIYTPFKREDAEQAINEFCDRDVSLPDAAEPVWGSWMVDGATLQLIARWSLKVGEHEKCNKPEKLSKTVPKDVCKERFMRAVDECGEGPESKYGMNPLTWNSPNGCIDFYVFADAEDWSEGCDGFPAGLNQCGDVNSGVRVHSVS